MNYLIKDPRFVISLNIDIEENEIFSPSLVLTVNMKILEMDERYIGSGGLAYYENIIIYSEDYPAIYCNDSLHLYLYGRDDSKLFNVVQETYVVLPEFKDLLLKQLLPYIITEQFNKLKII